MWRVPRAEGDGGTRCRPQLAGRPGNRGNRVVTGNRRSLLLNVLGFLAPNFLGFMVFTLVPVVLSFFMALTNWSLKPSVEFEFLGLRNYGDLLGVTPAGGTQGGVFAAYALSAGAMCVGLIAAFWANVARWKGAKLGGAIIASLGLAAAAAGLIGRAGHGQIIAGSIAVVFGLASMVRDDGHWRPGRGVLPALVLVAGAVGLWLLSKPMWQSYEPRDVRFWHYLYNTLYLMLGIPFAIGGALALALLVNERLDVGPRRGRIVVSLLCVACAPLTTLVIAALGHPDMGLLGGVLWIIAALGVAFNVVSFRTIFYLPTFTAGVALMILWKALYNPETGPINLGLARVFHALGWNIEPPKWLASVMWAKPALIIMGIWTAMGGTTMLLYLAALSNVPKALLEAARVDGAGAWARFRYVTWPQLAPTTFFVSVMATIGGLQGGFEQARVMTNGGPAGATTTLSFYIYTKAFQELDLGYAAAISWVMFALIFIGTAINWRFGKGLETEI